MNCLCGHEAGRHRMLRLGCRVGACGCDEFTPAALPELVAVGAPDQAAPPADPVVLAPSRLGPNDVEPCGTDSARRRHLAHGQTCAACGVPDGDR